MAYSTRSALPFAFAPTPWVKRLLVANGVAFLLTLLAGRGFVYNWFAFLPADILTRPWGLVTYMFVHGDFWHLFMNMLVLFFFGPPLEQQWGSREFIKYYLVCGLGGVLLSFLFVSNPILGASAAVYGVMLAFAVLWPEAPIYVWGIFPVKAKWLVGVLFLVTFLSAFGGAGGGIAHFAHLGGLVAGFLYLRGGDGLNRAVTRMRRGNPLQKLAIVPRDEGREGSSHPSMSSAHASRRKKEDAAERELLDRVDAVLDKISARGMGSLTPEERSLLDEVSRQRRTH
ncbi:MAG: rhomboid family intramembrane serine protease [Gemmatimonadota bacterium]